MAAAIRVYLADDHVVFQEGLEAILASREDVEVVGISSTGQKAAALVGRKILSGIPEDSAEPKPTS